jgi:uncharacterized protein YciI
MLFFGAISLNAQKVALDEEGFPSFEMTEGDTTYVMKQYFMVLLYKGENRSQGEKEAAEIQAGHMKHIQEMAAEGVLAVAGPMGGETDLRGVFIFNIPEKEDVEIWVQQDPAVIAGRLRAEIYPWWTAKGGRLP